MGMEGIRANGPATLPALPAQTPAPAAKPEVAAQQPGLSQADSFQPAATTQDPLGAATGQLNSQVSGRAGLVNDQLGKMDALMASNYRAWGWHKLMKEILDIWKPTG